MLIIRKQKSMHSGNQIVDLVLRDNVLSIRGVNSVYKTTVVLESYGRYGVYVGAHGIFALADTQIQKDRNTEELQDSQIIASGCERILAVFVGNLESTDRNNIVIRDYSTINNITSDVDYIVYDMNDTSSEYYSMNPRKFLMPRYAIKVNGVEYKLQGDVTIPSTMVAHSDVIPVEIIKYDYKFTKKLDEECDCESVAISCINGVSNKSEVVLENGRGKFNIYHADKDSYLKIMLNQTTMINPSDYVLFFE